MAEVEPAAALSRVNLGDEQPFDLGTMRVLPSELTVEVAGRRRDLQPRVMRVLIALARQRPDVVSRDRLSEECWDGRIVGDDAVNRCILALRHLADSFETPPFVIETVPRVGYRMAQPARNGLKPAAERPSHAVLKVTTSLAIAAIIGAILLGRPELWHRTVPVPTVLILPSAGSDPPSALLARQISIKFGSLMGERSKSLRLIGAAEGSSTKPNLELHVGLTGSPAKQGNLVLITSERGTSLWSKEFQSPLPNQSDLEQQITFSAARVLDCAADTTTGDNRLTEDDQKVYLNACTSLSDSRPDAARIVRSLRGVIARQPHFASAWAKLLEAETNELAESRGMDAGALRTSLARDVAAARKSDARLPEAYIAEYVLMDPIDFVGRARVLDAAIAHNPEHAGTHVERAIFLQSVGRVGDALQDARDAVRLDQLSPSAFENYITILAMAGRTDAARLELAKAERAWPGADSVVTARYVLNLRFGDPRDALRLLRSAAVDPGGAKMQEALLEARITPSPSNIEKAVRTGRDTLRFYPDAIDSYLQTLAEFHRKEEMFNLLLNWKRLDLVDAITGVLFRPAFAEFRRDPRFIRVAKHLGLLTYWRSSRYWPDYCEAPDLTYDCKAAAR